MRRTEAHGFRRGKLGAKPKLPGTFGLALRLVILPRPWAISPSARPRRCPRWGTESVILNPELRPELARGVVESLGKRGFRDRRWVPFGGFSCQWVIFPKALFFRNFFAGGGYTFFDLSRLNGAKPPPFFLSWPDPIWGIGLQNQWLDRLQGQSDL